MKQLITLFAVLILTSSIFAQAPEKMSYQAVVRDGSNELVTSSTVGMQISILQGSASGTAVYIETQTPTSNANGLVSLELGNGTAVSGDFSAIDWANGPFFIKTETDPTGATNYSISGTSEVMSVPYALSAKTAESITGTITEIDPAVEENFDFTGATDGDLLQFNGTKWTKVTPSYISDYTVTESDVTTHEAALSVTEGQISDFGTYLETETDPSVPEGTQVGEMQYWDGTKWVIIASTPNEGATLQMIDRVPRWVGGNTPPDAPRITSITVGNGQATIMIRPPFNDGGATIDFFTATSSPDGLTGTLTGNLGSGTSRPRDGSITITGLTNGTTYTFTVTATNRVGTSEPSETSVAVTPLSLSAGDSFEGGVVAYLLQPNDPGYDANVPHGIVAASNDQSAGAEWGCYPTEIAGADGFRIGTGAQNTINIDNACPTPGIAADICANLTLNGFSDWYLPSRDELDIIYQNRDVIGGFTTERYWSSSQVISGPSQAWYQQFSNGSSLRGDKRNTYRVRAVRSF